MKVIKRFMDWVDSKGEGAGDYMVAGVIGGALVFGVLTTLVGVILGPSSPVAAIGVSVVLSHIVTVMVLS